jgi:hypothetical protein
MPPTDDEVNEILNWCAEAEDSGDSKYPGMTYEQGVDAAVRWMKGEGEAPN